MRDLLNLTCVPANAPPAQENKDPRQLLYIEQKRMNAQVHMNHVNHRKTKVKPILTVQNVAELTGASTSFWREEIHSGRLVAFRLKAHYRVPIGALETWLTGRYPGGQVRVDLEAGELIFVPKPESAAVCSLATPEDRRKGNQDNQPKSTKPA